MISWRDLPAFSGTPELNDTISDLLQGMGVTWNGSVHSLATLYVMLDDFRAACDDRTMASIFGAVQELRSRTRHKVLSSVTYDDSDLLEPWLPGGHPARRTAPSPSHDHYNEQQDRYSDEMTARWQADRAFEQRGSDAARHDAVFGTTRYEQWNAERRDRKAVADEEAIVRWHTESAERRQRYKKEPSQKPIIAHTMIMLLVLIVSILAYSMAPTRTTKTQRRARRASPSATTARRASASGRRESPTARKSSSTNVVPQRPLTISPSP
jgi:hypothetical protein